jgi:hypothetical protein
LSVVSMLLSLILLLFTSIERLTCVSILSSGIVILALVYSRWRWRKKVKTMISQIEHDRITGAHHEQQ